jgi:hypothetical protein
MTRMHRARSVAAVVLLGLALAATGGLVALIVLAHIVGRTKVVHAGWWADHDDRPRASA